MNPIVELYRGLAALMVLLSHYYPHFISNELGWFNFFWTGVDLFFVLSGLVFAPYLLGRKFELLPFYARRFFRIYPLYALSLLLYHLYAPDHPQRDEFLLHHALFLNTTHSAEEALFYNPAYWSLPVEAEFYLALPLLALLLGARYGGLSLLLGLLALKYVTSLHNSLEGLDPLMRSVTMLNFHLPGMLLEFLLGVGLYRVAVQPPAPLAWTLRAGALLGGLLLLYALGDFFIRHGPAGLQQHPLLRAYFNVLCALSYALVLLPWLRLELKTGGWFRGFCLWMGSLSYGTYLFHNLLPKIQAAHGLPATGWSGLALATVATLALALVAYHGYENPLRRYGQGLFAPPGRR